MTLVVWLPRVTLTTLLLAGPHCGPVGGQGSELTWRCDFVWLQSASTLSRSWSPDWLNQPSQKKWLKQVTGLTSQNDSSTSHRAY